MADLPFRLILSALNKATPEVNSLQKSFGGLIGKLGLAAAGYMSVSKAADLIKTAISDASNLEESMNKVRVVFKSSADEVIEFAEDASDSLGMSKQQALAAAGTFGNLFSAMGIGAEKTSDMSRSLIELAADLASFNNMDPTVVLDKLRAGLVGEVEPLRTLGVNLNQAAIQAKAMELGLMEAGGELTAAAKAQSAYAIILEQTSLAQGDFARTSEGLANQQRILDANMADLSATIGGAFQPAAVEATGALNELANEFKNYIDVVSASKDATGDLQTAVDLGLISQERQYELLGRIADSHENYGEIVAEVNPVLDAFKRKADEGTAELDDFHERLQDDIPAAASTAASALDENSPLGRAFGMQYEIVDQINKGMETFTANLVFAEAAARLDSEAQLELGLALGVIDDKTLLLNAALPGLEEFYDANKNGAIDAGGEAANYAAAVQRLYDIIIAIPEYKKSTIELEYIVPNMPGPHEPYIPQQHGGDWIVNKPTLFLAGEGGAERATFTPLSGPVSNNYNYLNVNLHTASRSDVLMRGIDQWKGMARI